MSVTAAAAAASPRWEWPGSPRPRLRGASVPAVARGSVFPWVTFGISLSGLPARGAAAV